MPISLLLADDSEVMRNAVIRLLKSDPEIQLVGEATTFAQTMQLTSTLHPQVIVMDLHMGDERSVTPSIVKSSLMESRLVGISIWTDTETKALADSYGMVMLLDKVNLAAELIPAIKKRSTYTK